MPVQCCCSGCCLMSEDALKDEIDARRRLNLFCREFQMQNCYFFVSPRHYYYSIISSCVPALVNGALLGGLCCLQAGCVALVAAVRFHTGTIQIHHLSGIPKTRYFLCLGTGGAQSFLCSSLSEALRDVTGQKVHTFLSRKIQNRVSGIWGFSLL